MWAFCEGANGLAASSGKWWWRGIYIKSSLPLSFATRTVVRNKRQPTNQIFFVVEGYSFLDLLMYRLEITPVSELLIKVFIMNPSLGSSQPCKLISPQKLTGNLEQSEVDDDWGWSGIDIPVTSQNRPLILWSRTGASNRMIGHQGCLRTLFSMPTDFYWTSCFKPWNYRE